MRTLGIVISTYNTPCFIHLHLEQRKKLYPNIPTVIINDGQDEKVKILADKYNVDYIERETSLGHYYGDLASIRQGLHWADKLKVNYLCKFSRRLIPLTYPFEETFDRFLISNQDKSHHLPIRTEAAVFRVEDWLDLIPEEIKLEGIVEKYLFNLSKHLGLFQDWKWLGDTRRLNENYLWHDKDRTGAYIKLAIKHRLPYVPRDFVIRGDRTKFPT